MTVTIIPEKRIKTCDICGVETGTSNARHNGSVNIDKASLDYQGNPVASGAYSYDLCDKCLYAVEMAVESLRGKKT